ncbi:hypothetical protein EON65_23315 [archaeon]|nr:MAG: hypothetical protein EON65_23315 [archaeon]
MSDEPKREMEDTQIELKTWEEEKDRSKRPAAPPPPPTSKRATLKAATVSVAEGSTKMEPTKAIENTHSELKSPEEEKVRSNRPASPVPPTASNRNSVKATPTLTTESAIAAAVPANLKRDTSIQSDVGSVVLSEKGTLRRQSTNPFEYDVYDPSASVVTSNLSIDEEAQVVTNPLAGKLANPAEVSPVVPSPTYSTKKKSSVYLINSDINKSVDQISSSSIDQPVRKRPPKGSIFISPAVLGPGQPTNPIYHKNLYSEFWLVVFVIGIIVQFSLLLVVGYDPLPTGSFMLILILLLSSVALVLYSRLHVKKSYLSASRNIALRNGECSPDDEADEVSDSAVYALGAASVLLGLNFAIFTSVLSGSNVEFPSRK